MDFVNCYLNFLINFDPAMLKKEQVGNGMKEEQRGGEHHRNEAFYV